MQIGVTFRHVEADEGVKGYVSEKVGKLQKYIENPGEVHVVLSAEKFRQIAELTIVGNGMTLNSQGKNTDLYAAIDQMVDRMERQIRKRQKKSKRKRSNPTPAKGPPLSGDLILESSEEGETSSLIHRREAFAKPMSPEEAVAQFKLSQEDILFFINSNSGRLNALCRSKLGGYDWVEPQPE
jgi:putative sigma-54 modulation protein